jgi:hypothetical protein
MKRGKVIKQACRNLAKNILVYGKMPSSLRAYKIPFKEIEKKFANGHCFSDLFW